MSYDNLPPSSPEGGVIAKILKVVHLPEEQIAGFSFAGNLELEGRVEGSRGREDADNGGGEKENAGELHFDGLVCFSWRRSEASKNFERRRILKRIEEEVRTA